MDAALRLGGEIVSADSMKVYRGMDIGTAKASPERAPAVPHHLLDVADPGETFSTALWARLAEAAIADIHARGRAPVVSGGTPLYLKALLEGMFEGPAADAAIRDRLKAEAETHRHARAARAAGRGRPGGGRADPSERPPADRPGPGDLGTHGPADLRPAEAVGTRSGPRGGRWWWRFAARART